MSKRGAWGWWGFWLCWRVGQAAAAVGVHFARRWGAAAPPHAPLPTGCNSAWQCAAPPPPEPCSVLLRGTCWAARLARRCCAGLAQRAPGGGAATCRLLFKAWGVVFIPSPLPDTAATNLFLHCNARPPPTKSPSRLRLPSSPPPPRAPHHPHACTPCAHQQPTSRAQEQGARDEHCRSSPHFLPPAAGPPPPPASAAALAAAFSAILRCRAEASFSLRDWTVPSRFTGPALAASRFCALARSSSR